MSNSRPESILVTGGAGFIGSHLAESLVSRGKNVFVIDNLDPYYDPRMKRHNMGALLRGGNAQFAEADIRDQSRLQDIFARGRVEAVVHLAAKVGVRASIKRPAEHASVNVDGTLNVLEAARRSGVRRFVLASSSSVYGDTSASPMTESLPCDRPVSPYAATKRSAELLAHAYHAIHGMQVWVLRFFTVYGPRQRPDMAVHKFVKAAVDGRTLPLFGDVSTTRDYTYVADIVEGIVAAINRDVGFEIVNLGRGIPVRLDQLVGHIERALDTRVRTESLVRQAGDVRSTLASLDKAKRLLGYAPMTGIQEGIRSFVEWYRLHSDV